MEYTCRVKTLQALNKSMEKDEILLFHKLQRPEGQWNRKQKTDLIDSLLRNYPINPTYAIKDGKILSVIDGVQRLSCIRDFLNNKFALSKDMESVIVNGQEKSLGGLRFKKLDEDVKDAILNAELQIYELTDCTEKDVREMFRRQNAGKPLNVRQLRVVKESDVFSEQVYTLATHPFMDKLMTNAQVKNGTNRDLIIQTFMLLLSNEEHEFVSFRTKDIDSFILNYSNLVNEEMVKMFNNTLSKFYTATVDIPYNGFRIPTTSIPMILYSGYKVVEGEKDFNKFIVYVRDFLNEYSQNEEYKKFVQSATSSSENVRGRFEYWEQIVNNI